MRLAIIIVAAGCAFGQANPVVRTAGTLTSTNVLVGGGGQLASASTLTATVTKMTSGVPSAATVGTDYGTPDATAKTFTNTTYDAAAAGNVLTFIKSDYRPAAICNNVTATLLFDLPTAAAATLLCLGTTSTLGVLSFADGSTQITSARVALPSTWVSTGFTVNLIYSGSASSTNTINWRVSTACVADGESMIAPSYNATSTNSAAGPATTPQRKSTSFTPAVTNCAASETMFIRVEKVTGDAYVGSGYLIALEVVYTITQ